MALRVLELRAYEERAAPDVAGQFLVPAELILTLLLVSCGTIIANRL